MTPSPQPSLNRKRASKLQSPVGKQECIRLPINQQHLYCPPAEPEPSGDCASHAPSLHFLVLKARAFCVRETGEKRELLPYALFSAYLISTYPRPKTFLLSLFLKDTWLGRRGAPDDLFFLYRNVPDSVRM